MHRTEVISYPRSGYRITKHIVREYFGSEFKNGDVYSSPPKTIDRDPSINFQKNHDLNLQTKIKDRHYLVLIRYPLESLISYYKLEVDGHRCGSDQNDWKRFALDKINYWIKFYEKWVSRDMKNKYVLNYAELIDNPCSYLEKAVRFLDDKNRPIDKNKIRIIVDESQIKRRNHMKNFSYYNEEFFNKLRNKVKHIPGIDIKKDVLL